MKIFFPSIHLWQNATFMSTFKKLKDKLSHLNKFEEAFRNWFKFNPLKRIHLLLGIVENYEQFEALNFFFLEKLNR